MNSFERWRVLRQLESPEAEARAHAVRRLIEEGKSREAELLTAYLVHDDPETRRAAQEALKGLADRALEPLLRELRRGYREMRLAAAKVLAELGLPEAETALVTRLEEEDEETVRAAIVQVLAESHSERVASAVVVAAMRDPAPVVRREATGLLRQRTDPLAREVLWIQLGDADAEVRRLAAEALGEHPDPDVPLEPLLELLEDPEPQVREAAARAVAAAGYEPDDERFRDLFSQALRGGAEDPAQTGSSDSPAE